MRLSPLIPALTVAAALAPAHSAEIMKVQAPPSTALASTVRAPEALRLLSLGADEARLGGEAGTRVVPLYVLPAEAARPAKLRISALTAISAIPDASRMVVSVNDVVVGERSLHSTAKPEALTFDIPPGLLEAGYNAVRLSVRHVHRVDCSRQGSYELWTRILTENSGVSISGARVEIRELRDLAAVQSTPAGATRIRVRSYDGDDKASLARVSRAVQAIVLAGHIARPLIELNSSESTEPGIELFVGTQPTVDLSEGARSRGSNSRNFIQHDLQNDRVLVSVTGSTPEQLDAALAALESSALSVATPLGSDAGLRGLASAHGAKVNGGDTLTLASMGFANQRFGGRYYRQSALLQMPEDFYPGPYGAITLRLDAAYGYDLLPTSKISIRVNGAVVSSTPLQNPAGEVLAKKAIRLPLNVFKPGLNSVDIEAETTAVSDAECSAPSQAQLRDRLLISNTSLIEVPQLARIATLPNLASVPVGALSRLDPNAPLHVFLPSQTPEAMEAALGLLAKTAFLSGRIAPVAFSFDSPDQNAAHILAIGTISDMPASVLKAAGLDPEELQMVWRGSVQEEELVASHAPVRVAAADLDLVLSSVPANVLRTEQRGSERRHLLAETTGALGMTLPDGAMSPAWGWEQNSLVHKVRNELASSVEAVRKAALWGESPWGIGAERPNRGKVASPSSRMVIAQGASALQGGMRSGLLPEVTSSTVFVAPTAELLRAGMIDLVSTNLVQQLTGDAASVDRTGSPIRSRFAAATWFVPTQALEPSNLRRIVAGWLSQNIMAYVAALAGLATLLTCFTYQLVRRSGVRG